MENIVKNNIKIGVKNWYQLDKKAIQVLFKLLDKSINPAEAKKLFTEDDLKKLREYSVKKILDSEQTKKLQLEKLQDKIIKLENKKWFI